MIAIWLIIILIAGPLVISAAFGLLFGLVVKQSTRKAIVLVSALGPSLLTAICGGAISYLAVQADAGLEFFFGYIVIMLGFWTVLPGMFAGRVVARHLRPREDAV